jgi:hypothetical protein
MHDDLDLSNLLHEVPPPEGGAEAARKTAVQRRHRRQAIASSVGAFAILGAGVVGALVVKSNDEAVVIRDAGSNQETSTTAESTTSTTLDARQRYVGTIHDMSGAGLPFGTKLVSSGFPESTPGELKKGQHIIHYVTDDLGAMVWIEEILKVDNFQYNSPTQLEVKAVFELPQLKDDLSVCIADCARDNQPVKNVIGFYQYDGTDKPKFVYAGQFDIAKLTFKKTTTEGLRPWVGSEEAPLPELPARPQLYRDMFKHDNDTINRIALTEDLEPAGGGGTADGHTYWRIKDNREHKDVWVVSKDDKDAIVTVDYSDDAVFNFPMDFVYKGKNVKLLTYVADQPTNNDPIVVLKAWLFDPANVTFTPVSVDQITPAPTTTVAP